MDYAYTYSIAPYLDMDFPDDIDLENRKNIVRKALDEIRGKLIKAEVEDKRRLKNREFSRTKKRRKIAQACTRRNRR